jgi:hypothetical protein
MFPTFQPAAVERFFALFAAVNQAMWPMQIVWYALAVAAIVLLIRPIGASSRLISAFLSVYYVWIGVVFFWMFQSRIDDGAGLHGAMYVLGGILFLVAGVVRRDLTFRPGWNALSIVGGLLVAYALVLYPILGMLAGHVFPAAPVFGIAPCPTTIFTFGLLLWTCKPAPSYVLLIPLLWSLIAAPSAIGMGVYEDIAMPVATILGTALIVWRDRVSTRQVAVAGLVLAVLLAFAGNNDVLLGLGLILLVVTLAREFVRTRGGTTPTSPKGQLPQPVR